MELYAVVKPCRLYKKRSSSGGGGKVAMCVRSGGDGGAGKSRPSFTCRCVRLVKEQRASVQRAVVKWSYDPTEMSDEYSLPRSFALCRVRTLQEYTGQLAEEEASAAEEESPIESFPLPRKIRYLMEHIIQEEYSGNMIVHFSCFARSLLEIKTVMSETIDLTGDRCILKTVIRRAKDDATAPSDSLPIVDVHYEGTLAENGEVFDTTHEDNSVFSFEIGEGTVIKAWDIAVKTMKVGEVAKITCKPEYAYGAAGSPPEIPPDATLTFEVELIACRPRKGSSVESVSEEKARLEELKKQREIAAAAKEEEKRKREEAKAAAAARVQAKLEAKKGKGKKAK
ncbi:hypothetical protein OsJ_04049 [Oryza sativa Japonica Group]|uniref:peptidylprolyl isomerase n=7 Tax=Oryza TaxID=4527 RepID=B9EUD5_ORYSJ|nr:hypothetical protein OsJ_04049 [Oryza sativa Japonica Group]